MAQMNLGVPIRTCLEDEEETPFIRMTRRLWSPRTCLAKRPYRVLT